MFPLSPFAGSNQHSRLKNIQNEKAIFFSRHFLYDLRQVAEFIGLLRSNQLSDHYPAAGGFCPDIRDGHAGRGYDILVSVEGDRYRRNIVHAGV